MHTTGRYRALVFALTVLYAGTMLLGQALHALTGCEHHLAGVGEHEACDHDVCSHDNTQTQYSAADDDHEADVCPICQFHSQGQSPAAAVAAVWHLLAAPHSQAHERSAPASAHHEPYLTRGPPLAAIL